MTEILTKEQEKALKNKLKILIKYGLHYYTIKSKNPQTLNG